MSKTRLEKISEDTGRKHYFLYRCSCGTEKIIYKYNVQSGKALSCGCLKKELPQCQKRIMCKRTYKSYHHMKYRCLNPNSDSWDYYGGRGIKVCDRWLESYENFYEDMGPRPDNTTIDRIRVNGNYEPGNCRWATVREQSLNKRRNTRYEFYGVSLTEKEWCEVMELPRQRIGGRISKGVDPFTAIFTPSKSKARPFGKKVLTECNVIEIKKMLLNGESQGKISDIYNVGRKTISDINTGKTWKSI